MRQQIIRVARQILKQWFNSPYSRILVGAGAGLRFNPGRAGLNYGVGNNEWPVQRALVAQLRPGHIFYDIGANVGFFTVIAAKLVGPTGHVYAFEPVPENVQRIRQNVGANQLEQVTVLEKAVSCCSQQSDLILAHHAGGATLAAIGTPPDAKESISVEVVSLDELVNGGLMLPPHVVKIDVEGAELHVLEGMSEIMRRYRPVLLIEVDDGDWDRFQAKQARLLCWFQSYPYFVTRLEDSYQNLAWHVWHAVAIPCGDVKR